MKNLKICAAVSAALLSSSGAFALNQADTAAAPTQLVVAGASAARDNFQAEFQLLCQAATTNLYRALPDGEPGLPRLQLHAAERGAGSGCPAQHQRDGVLPFRRWLGLGSGLGREEHPDQAPAGRRRLHARGAAGSG